MSNKPSKPSKDFDDVSKAGDAEENDASTAVKFGIGMAAIIGAAAVPAIAAILAKKK